MPLGFRKLAETDPVMRSSRRLTHVDLRSVYLDSSRRGTVSGRLAFRDSRRPVHLWLSGDARPGLEGRRLHFELAEPGHVDPESNPSNTAAARRLHDEQIGPPGIMLLKGRPGCSKDLRLCLEWMSQDGHVVLEALVRRFESHAGPPPRARSRTPRGLFEALDRLAWQDVRASMSSPIRTLAARSVVRTACEEFSAGAGDATLAELVGGTDWLPDPAALTSRAASHLVGLVLARLAREWVAVDICEHFRARDAYRFLWLLAHDSRTRVPRRRREGAIERFLTHEVCVGCCREIVSADPELDEIWTRYDAPGGADERC